MRKLNGKLERFSTSTGGRCSSQKRHRSVAFAIAHAAAQTDAANAKLKLRTDCLLCSSRRECCCIVLNSALRLFIDIWSIAIEIGHEFGPQRCQMMNLIVFKVALYENEPARQQVMKSDRKTPENPTRSMK